MQEERWQERKDMVLVELQREAHCLSPTAILPHSQIPCTPHLHWPWFAGCGEWQATKKLQERGREAISIRLW